MVHACSHERALVLMAVSIECALGDLLSSFSCRHSLDSRYRMVIAPAMGFVGSF
jgi:hypothetical protein